MRAVPNMVQRVVVATVVVLVCASRGRGQSAEEILRASGVKGGLVVHVGCGDGSVTVGLRANDGFLVHGLAADAAKTAEARSRIRKLGLYGPVSVEHWTHPFLPYADGVAKLAVVSADCRVPSEEVLRVLAPRGVAMIEVGEEREEGSGFRGQDRGWTDAGVPAEGTRAQAVEIDGRRWLRFVKPRPADLDEWTHFLHDSSGNAVSQDLVAGSPRRMQWVAAPTWARSHEHQATVSGLVCTSERVFTIVDEGPTASVLLPPKWALVARDAFSGVTLWKRRVGQWEEPLRPFRSGPAELPRRLVADGDALYATLGYGQPVSVLDAATGRTRQDIAGTEGTTEIIVCDGVLFLVAGDIDSAAAAAAAKRRAAVPPPRNKRVLAVRAASGSLLWRRSGKDTSEVLPLTLAVADGRAFFQNTTQLICLDAATGEPVWQVARPASTKRPAWSTPTLVVHDGVVLSADRTVPRSEERAADQANQTVEWIVSYAGGGKPGELIAFSAKTGQELWRCACAEGYNSPVDLFVAGGLVWTGRLTRAGEPGITEGRDLKTGEVKRTRSRDQEFFRVGMSHHRCHRNRATERYLILGRAGVEFVDIATGKAEANHWVRGACQYGTVPANGLLYAPSHSCACYLETKLNGFNALAPKEGSRGEGRGARHGREPRLQRGPAYGLPLAIDAIAPASVRSDWPTYRHDAVRSGSTPMTVPVELKEAWRREVGERLSSVVVAGGRLFVADIDAQTVYALDAGSGHEVWSYTAGGRVDSPPTVYDGRVVFGAADGWVTCLRAADGALCWRYRAAPEERRIVAYDRVESAWPVHGSVLVVPPRGPDGHAAVCFAAGRSGYLDGGILMYRLDLATGEVLAETRLNDRDPTTGLEPQERVKGFGMDGVLPDVLSTDGTHVFMRHMVFSAEELKRAGDTRHLFCTTGFLDATWWHRSYWMFAARYVSGWGGWWQAGNQNPSGRLLVLDASTIYGFGRSFMPSGNAGQWSEGESYRLFATGRDSGTLPQPEPVPGARKRRQARAPRTSVVKTHWSKGVWMEARAMVLAGSTLFLAGPTGDTHRSQDAFEGREGVVLKVVSAEDGRAVAAYQLDALPVFDGMAAAEGCLFLAMADGTVRCMGASGRPLDTVATKPNEDVSPPPPPEPPSPAKPPPPLPKARAHREFTELSQCTIADVDGGYRVASDSGKVGLALRELSAPLTGKVTLKVRAQAVPGYTTPQRYRNGFLAFGDGAADELLVKCGLKFIVKQCMIVEGPTTGSPIAAEKLAGSPDRAFDMAAVVDLNKQTVTLTLEGSEIKAQLGRRLETITHVGYAVLNAVTDFSRVEVRGE